MSMVPKPGCGLESECGTVNFFLRAYVHIWCIPLFQILDPPMREIHPCSKTLNYASCGLVHQSFTIKFKPSNPPPPPPPPPPPVLESKKRTTLYQFQLFLFQLFSLLFQLPLSSVVNGLLVLYMYSCLLLDVGKCKHDLGMQTCII